MSSLIIQNELWMETLLLRKKLGEFIWSGVRKLGRGRRDSVIWGAKLQYWDKHLPRSETGVYISPSCLCLYRIERGRKSCKSTQVALSLTNISISKWGEAKLIMHPEKMQLFSSPHWDRFCRSKWMNKQINKRNKNAPDQSLSHTLFVLAI